MSQDVYVVIEHLQGKVAEISYVMLAAARTLALKESGKVIAVLLGHNAEGLAANLAADQVIYLDHPALAEFTSDAYQMTLAALVGKEQPRVVLFGSTSIGADVASVLSIRLGIPLISSCCKFDTDGKFVSQICGGKIMAEGELPGPMALVTMVPGSYKPEQGQTTQPPAVSRVDVSALEALRVRLLGYIEPEAGDVDISKEQLLIAIGRGIQTKDNIELVEELAHAMNGVVCGSRPVIDQGWLATSRLVGKSGKQVKPKVYLALGISGAPEHVEAITESDKIIAINTDPKAPIFGVAQYGVEMDMFDLLQPLIDQVNQAKGG